MPDGLSKIQGAGAALCGAAPEGAAAAAVAESSSAAEAAPAESAERGTLMNHSCWTYWGHSGAPLFNEAGQVVALHCAWDERTGMRQAQKLSHLHAVLEAAGKKRKKRS